MKFFALVAILSLAIDAHAQGGSLTGVMPKEPTEAVYGDSGYYQSTDGLSHSFFKAYLTQTPRGNAGPFKLVSYGVGAEQHTGQARTFRYQATKLNFYATTRFRRNIYFDVATGMNRLADRFASETSERETALPFWSVGLAYVPHEKFSAFARAGHDLLYYEWLEPGATAIALSGRSALIGLESRGSRFRTRTGGKLSELSDGNGLTTMYGSVLHESSVGRGRVVIGPAVTRAAFRNPVPDYYSPRTWTWTAARIELGHPIAKNVDGEIKVSAGPAWIADAERRLYTEGEARLSWLIGETAKANVVYAHTDSSNSFESWKRSRIGASLDSAF